MRDYFVLAKRYSIYTAILIVLFLALAGIFTKPSLFLGLALGSLFSLFNLTTTYFQVKRIMTSLETGKPKWALGTVSRVISAVLAVYIAMSYPEIFDMTGVIIGLMVTYVLILIEPIFYIKRSQ